VRADHEVRTIDGLAANDIVDLGSIGVDVAKADVPDLPRLPIGDEKQNACRVRQREGVEIRTCLVRRWLKNREECRHVRLAPAIEPVDNA